MATASLLSFSLCLLLLSSGSLAQTSYQESQRRQPWQSGRRFRGHTRCRFDRLNTLEPSRRFQSEAGVTEHFDETNEQMQCAGVAAIRRVIQPRGLLLPSFSNAPRLVYILQGRGVAGTVMPGCPETFQSFEQSREPRGHEGRSLFRDQHQRVNRYRQGDILALPAGVAYWAFNDGDSPLVAITVFDTSSSANQLDRFHRQFLLAGRKQRGEEFGVYPTHEESTGNNIFSGFDTETLAEALGISRELATRLKSENDQRGEIVRVKEGFQVVKPWRMEEEERDERRMNGLEETFCSMKIKQNIDNPERADIFHPRAGRITTLNSQKLPILRFLQLSAVRGVVHRNAFVAPHWNMNAHAIVYATRGRGRVQVVDNQGRNVFHGDFRQGQLMIFPQHFLAMTQAYNEGFEYVAFKTNDNAMVSPIVGKTSAFRGMPEDVLASSFNVSREEARRLKFNREDETLLFTPRSSQPLLAAIAENLML